jgi:hypothetical protein
MQKPVSSKQLTETAAMDDSKTEPARFGTCGATPAAANADVALVSENVHV